MLELTLWQPSLRRHPHTDGKEKGYGWVNAGMARAKRNIQRENSRMSSPLDLLGRARTMPPEISRSLIMRRYNMLLTGLLMVGAGAYLFHASPQILPLWFVWLTGSLLWCVGIAVSIAGVAVPLFVLHEPVPPPRLFTDSVAKPTAMSSRQVPIEVLLLQIENHVRLEQAAAESFLAFPTHDHLHSKTPSPFVN
jgi:hypothetical protein